MVLGGDVFIQEYAKNMVQILHSTLRNVRDRVLLASVDVVDVIIRAFPQDCVRVCSYMLRTILDNVNQLSESGVVNGAYIRLISMALLVNIGDMKSNSFLGNEVCVSRYLISFCNTLTRCFDYQDDRYGHWNSYNCVYGTSVGCRC